MRNVKRFWERNPTRFWGEILVAKTNCVCLFDGLHCALPPEAGRVTQATKISFDDDDDDFSLPKQRDCLRGAAPGGERQRETRDPLHTRFL